MLRVAVSHYKVACSDRTGNQKCARLNAVGIDAIVRTMQTRYAVHLDHGATGSLNPGAHRAEQRC